MSKLENLFCGIERERWMIMRDGTEILCGLARNYTFKPVADIGNAAVKTYLSKAKAISAFESSCHIKFDNDRYEVVKIMESYRPYADNPPLTLAELREMEGEIVYVRSKDRYTVQKRLLY